MDIDSKSDSEGEFEGNVEVNDEGDGMVQL